MTDNERIAWLEHNLASANQAFEEMKALAGQRLTALKEAEHSSASLTWLFTHCLAIGMDCKSDSGKWEHDIALFTSNQKKEIESLREQLTAVEQQRDDLQAQVDALMLEYCPNEMTEEQLANWAKHQVPVSAEEQASIDAAIAAARKG